MLACNILSSTFQIGLVAAFAIIPQNLIAFASYQLYADTASMVLSLHGCLELAWLTKEKRDVDSNGKNKLFDPEIRKKINFDARMQTLLGRKSVNRNSIYNLLTPHLSKNLELSEDEFEFESENIDEDDLVPRKRQQQSSSNAKSNKKVEVVNFQKRCFASIVPKNIRLLYLRKSLVEGLPKQLETFEAKEECEDLCQRVKNGLLKRPTVLLQKLEEQSMLLCVVLEVIADDVDPEPILENAMIKDEQEPNDGSSESALGRTTETPCCDLKCNGTSCCQNGANNAAGIEAKDACNVYGTKELELVIKYPQDCKCRKQYMRNQK
ncbi:hypothetical protein Q3G72_030115 [Acer saccharum]|nr:hypothetical protein Q3G72_030115 [Acer saccharum]